MDCSIPSWALWTAILRMVWPQWTYWVRACPPSQISQILVSNSSQTHWFQQNRSWTSASQPLSGPSQGFRWEIVCLPEQAQRFAGYVLWWYFPSIFSFKPIVILIACQFNKFVFNALLVYAALLYTTVYLFTPKETKTKSSIFPRFSKNIKSSDLSCDRHYSDPLLSSIQYTRLPVLLLFCLWHLLVCLIKIFPFCIVPSMLQESVLCE